MYTNTKLTANGLELKKDGAADGRVLAGGLV
jgi:hypothetical protein